MRSPEEILFRTRQEIANVVLWRHPPVLRHTVPVRMPGLPDPQTAAGRLRGSDYAGEVISIADRLLAHEFPLLGITISTGAGVHWRRDYVSAKETDTRYFRRIPYLNAGVAGDHKIIWELNRHQHFVVLAQAFLLTGRREYLLEVFSQLQSWLDENPFQCGINWASALEVAFRALSWMWLHHLAGEHMPDALRLRFLDSLYQHAWHLEYNLSFYFSRNTHLLGEAVALHALGLLFGNSPRAGTWVKTGARVVRSELDFQVLEDGAHFEQSAYYHVYALDLFVLHYILAGRPLEYRPVLTKMADYLRSLLGPAGCLPLLGDDDGGRLFHPYGDHSGYGRASAATCSVLFERPEWLYDASDLRIQAAWWLDGETWQSEQVQEAAPAAPPSRVFPNTGIAVLSSGARQVIVDAGSFGFARGGHSHSDSLSILARDGSAEILVDSGTFTYVGDPALRDWFRGSAAHNVIRVNGQDQAEPAGPFAWTSKPAVRIRDWRSAEGYDFLDADCRYSGICHRRRVLFLKPAVLIVLDSVQTGLPSAQIEQIWHFGGEVSSLSGCCYRIASRARLTIPGGAEAVLEFGGRLGWRAPAFGCKQPAYALCVGETASETTLTAVLDFTSLAEAANVDLQAGAGDTRITWRSGNDAVRVRFPLSDLPEWEFGAV